MDRLSSWQASCKSRFKSNSATQKP